MGDEQGPVATQDPVATAVDDELRRLIRLAEDRAATGRYPLGGRRSTVYAVMREAFPEIINRERWQAFAGKVPDASEDPQEQARAAQERREQEAERIRMYEGNLALIRQHNPRYLACCHECVARDADEIRARATAPPLPDMPDPVPVHVEPVQERTCECESCTGEECQGDCDQYAVGCDDADCTVHRCDGAMGCCGYCLDCDTHHGDGDDDRCNMGHCHECDHRCDDY